VEALEAHATCGKVEHVARPLDVYLHGEILVNAKIIDGGEVVDGGDVVEGHGAVRQTEIGRRDVADYKVDATGERGVALVKLANGVARLLREPLLHEAGRTDTRLTKNDPRQEFPAEKARKAREKDSRHEGDPSAHTSAWRLAIGKGHPGNGATSARVEGKTIVMVVEDDCDDWRRSS
jgi:hypothetical protein